MTCMFTFETQLFAARPPARGECYCVSRIEPARLKPSIQTLLWSRMEKTDPTEAFEG